MIRDSLIANTGDGSRAKFIYPPSAGLGRLACSFAVPDSRLRHGALTGELGCERLFPPPEVWSRVEPKVEEGRVQREGCSIHTSDAPQKGDGYINLHSDHERMPKKQK
jgi:hypothetical protein